VTPSRVIRDMSEYAVHGVPFGVEPPFDGPCYVEQGFLRRELRGQPGGPLDFAGPGDVLHCSRRSPVLVTASSDTVLVRRLPTGTARQASLETQCPMLPGATTNRDSSEDLAAVRADRYRAAHPGVPARVRLARLLLDLAIGGRSEPQLIDVIATQAELARAVGASLASVENALRELRVNGAIATRRQRYIILDRARLACAAMPDEPPESSRPLRTCGSHTPVVPMMADRLAAALDLPQIVTDIARPQTLFSQLLRNRQDFGILEYHTLLPVPIPHGVRARRVATAPVFIALPEGHALGACDTVPLTALAACDWVVDPPEESNEHAVLELVCAAAGFKPRLRHRVGAVFVARELVRSGAVSLAHAASREGDGVTIRPLVEDPITNETWLVWNPMGRLARHAGLAYQAAAEAHLSLVQRSSIFQRWWRDHRQLQTDLDTTRRTRDDTPPPARLKHPPVSQPPASSTAGD
jgi:CRP-like cAMP-binding protein